MKEAIEILERNIQRVKTEITERSSVIESCKVTIAKMEAGNSEDRQRVAKLEIAKRQLAEMTSSYIAALSRRRKR